MDLLTAARALGLNTKGLTEPEVLSFLAKKLKEGDRPGPARGRMEDLRRFPPGAGALDHFRFEAQISTAGAVAEQAGPASVPDDMDFFLREVRGYIQEADTDQAPDNWARLRFNAKIEGMGRDMFTSSLSMAELLGALSPARGLTWPEGVFRIGKGRTITPSFSVETGSTGPGSWRTTTNSKVVGIVFIGEAYLPL